MAEMSKAKVTPRVKHLERTQLFAATVKEALDAFEEEIGLLDEDIRSGAYRKLLEAYKHALEPVWNLAHLADIDIILKTVSDQEMLQLRKMSKQLQPAPTTAKVIKETPNIPSLETILPALKDRLPKENLPSTQKLVMSLTKFTVHTKHLPKRPKVLPNCQQKSPLSNTLCY